MERIISLNQSVDHPVLKLLYRSKQQVEETRKSEDSVLSKIMNYVSSQNWYIEENKDNLN